MPPLRLLGRKARLSVQREFYRWFLLEGKWLPSAFFWYVRIRFIYSYTRLQRDDLRILMVLSLCVFGWGVTRVLLVLELKVISHMLSQTACDCYDTCDQMLRRRRFRLALQRYSSRLFLVITNIFRLLALFASSGVLPSVLPSIRNTSFTLVSFLFADVTRP